MNRKYSTHLSLEDRKNIELGITERFCKPLLDRGQTIYQILENHKKIFQCSKTLYTNIYI